MKKNRSKLGAFVLVVVIVFLILVKIEATPYRKIGGQSAINNEQTANNKAENKSNSEIIENKTNSAGDEIVDDSLTQKENTFKSGDGNWQINYRSSFKVEQPNDNKAVFKSSDNTQLLVLSSNEVQKTFQGYSDISTEDTTVTSEKAKKITKDSRDHAEGYPASRIIVLDFNHNQTDYQFVYSFDFLSQENAQSKMNELDNFIKSFQFINN